MSEKYTPEEIIEAINKACGVQTEAARMLGAHRNTIRNYANRYPKVAKALRQANERLLDEAEASLIKLVRQGEFRAVRYVLNCKGGHRGWGDRKFQREAAPTPEDRQKPVMLYPAEGILNRMREKPSPEELDEMMYTGDHR